MNCVVKTAFFLMVSAFLLAGPSEGLRVEGTFHPHLKVHVNANANVNGQTPLRTGDASAQGTHGGYAGSLHTAAA